MAIRGSTSTARHRRWSSRTSTARERAGGRALRHPWRLASLALWVIGLRHGTAKSWGEDLALLGKAARLAVVLEGLGATRVHSPWADRSALIARLAAAI